METMKSAMHDGVRMIDLNRPRRRNAINRQMLVELDTVLNECTVDPEIRALVITGNEQAFCAGQDLKEPEPPDFVHMINMVFDRLSRLPIPTVAAIDGWCLAGGLELALACDLRVAATEAQIGDRHAPIGSIGGAGATVRLTKLIGPTRTKELVFSATVLDAEGAYGIGLVSRVYPRVELRTGAIEFARSLCAGDRLTTAYAKEAINAAIDISTGDANALALTCQESLRARLERDYTREYSGNSKSNEEN